MAKRALIVGVSDYAPVAHDLPSARLDIAEWEDLLDRSYGFTQIRSLVDERATKAAVADGLTWLLARAGTGDQLVFIFCGHGARIPGRNTRLVKDGLHDEAIILYPGAATDLLDAAFWDDELTDLYRTMSVPDAALPTFIFDCCFSAGVDFSELPALEGPPAPPSGLSRSDRQAAGAVRFGLNLTYASPSVPPLIIAASSATSVALEIDTPRGKRSLFSELAITALRENPSLSCQELLRMIAPRMQYAQQPSVRGKTERIQKPLFH